MSGKLSSFIADTPHPQIPWPGDDATCEEVAAVIDAKITAAFDRALLPGGPKIPWSDDPWIMLSDPLAKMAKRLADSAPKAEHYQRLGAAFTQAVDACAAAMTQRTTVVMDPWSGADEQAAREACDALVSRSNRYQLPHHIILNGVDVRVSPGALASDVHAAYVAAAPGWYVRADEDGATCGPVAIWDNQSLALVPPDLVDCPRCDGTGEESTFSRRITCEVCEGEKTIPQTQADAEIARRNEERKRWA